MLKQITDDLLAPHHDHAKLFATATQLYALFSSITRIHDSSQHVADSHEILTASGKALSPIQAARCILDAIRTSKFLRGVYAAICEAQRCFPNQTIQILYAGCGPFAPLALPLMTQFSATQIQFTLLDVHQRSLEAVRDITQSLGLSPFVRDYIQCDAASYTHPTLNALHIVVTETMQTALEKEPQVAISMNLVPQLAQGGILIPEKISIDACLSDLQKEFPNDHTSHKERRHLDRVFELSAETCRDLPEQRASFPNVMLDVPHDVDEGLALMLLTTITVFDSIVLRDYESGLTYPKVLHDLGGLRGGARIAFHYMLGDKPGFEYRMV